MASKTSQLIVTLVDRVTGPANTAASAIGKIGAAARSAGGGNGGIAGAMAANAARIDSLRMKLVDAAAGYFAIKKAVGAPINAAKNFETVLLDIAQKADLSDQAMKGLGERIRAVAMHLQQAPSAVAKGVDILAGMGMDPEKAMIAMAPIAKAATAYRAEVDDLSRASFAAMDNLKVPAEELAKALDIMAQSGKEGAFELKDMAAEFPSLTAAAQALGMKGTKAIGDLSAALQVARSGAGTSAEAANNVANLMQKIVSPETTKKFKKLGVDIRKELKLAQAEGRSPIEMIAEQTVKALKGDLSKLGDVFEDRQVQQALRPLIQKLDEYRRIRETSLNAGNVLDDDYVRRLKTAQAGIDKFKAAVENLGIAVGRALLPSLTQNVAALSAIVTRVADLADKYPQLTQAVVTAATAIVGFRVATIAAAFAAAQLRAAVLGVVAFLARPLMATGIGAALLAIGAAAKLAYENFDGIKSALSGFGDGFTQAIAPVQPILEPIAAAAERLYNAVSSLLGPINATDAAWKSWGATVGGIVGGAITTVVSGIERLISLLGTAVSKAYEFGQAAKSWLTTPPAVGPRRDMGPVVTPKSLGENIDGTRADGGPVAAGRTYLVGERGPELFKPSRSGDIIPNGAKTSAPSINLSIARIVINAGEGATEIAASLRARLETELRQSMRTLYSDIGAGVAG